MNEELMNELRHAAFEVLLLHPGTTRDTWVHTLMDEYAEVSDALGTDAAYIVATLTELWGKEYTDTATGTTRTYAEWAALFATDDGVQRYYDTIPT